MKKASSKQVRHTEVYKMVQENWNYHMKAMKWGSSKLTREIKQLIESNMRANDETTAMQLHQILTSCGYNLSKRTILRCRSSLG